tara:strand:+ start:1173 stop:2552 length:1380 start_codon:yes stop_codon:yes gene_type:complete
MYTGPNLKKDALVFGYDTGEFSSDNPNHAIFKPVHSNNRHFKGSASRNHIAAHNAVRKFPLEPLTFTASGSFAAKHPNDIKAYDVNGNRLQTYVNQGVGNWTNTYHAHWQHDRVLNKPVVVMEDLDAQWKAKSFGTGLGTWNSLGLTHGSKYTISWLQWVDHLSKNAKAGLYTRNTSGNNGFHDGQANSASSYNTKLRTWQRVYQTYTTNSVRDLSNSYASIYMYGHYNVRATVKIADVQIDLLDHPTSYQEFSGSTTERSSTQGLLDLTGNTTIDTSTVSFNEHGFPTFDGTGDYFTTTTNCNVVSDITLEAVFNETGSSTPHTTVICTDIDHQKGVKLMSYKNNDRYGLWLGFGTSSYVAMFSEALSNNTIYHLVGTWKQSTGEVKIYLNGVLKSTISTGQTSNVILNTGKVTVGKDYHNSSYGINGQIYLGKVYNKVLTAEDIKQNYKAYKNRFNI